MNRTRKGITLVEVIVAIAVFTIISLALFTSFLGMRKVVAKQEEYVRLEMVCYDIKYYWEQYGIGWDEVYFLNKYDDAKIIEPNNNNLYTAYLKYEDGKFAPDANGQYRVTYTMKDNELTIKSIYNTANKRVYVEDVVWKRRV